MVTTGQSSSRSLTFTSWEMGGPWQVQRIEWCEAELRRDRAECKTKWESLIYKESANKQYKRWTQALQMIKRNHGGEVRETSLKVTRADQSKVADDGSDGMLPTTQRPQIDASATYLTSTMQRRRRKPLQPVARPESCLPACLESR